MKIRYVCEECGSQDVEIENWNRWNVETQAWEYASEGGDTWWCPKCESHTKDVDEETIE